MDRRSEPRKQAGRPKREPGRRQDGFKGARKALARRAEGSKGALEAPEARRRRPKRHLDSLKAFDLGEPRDILAEH